jgi:hypothetical protein
VLGIVVNKAQGNGVLFFRQLTSDQEVCVSLFQPFTGGCDDSGFGVPADTGKS